VTPTVQDRVAELLEEAARLAGAGDGAAAGALALEAAALLPHGDPDRHRAFASAAALLAAAGRHATAADAWAYAAEAAHDDVPRARALTAEGESARLAGMWWRAIEAHEQALTLAEATDGSSVDTAIIAQNLAITRKYTGRFDEAEPLYHRALAIAERCGEQRLVAVVCHNLGGLAHARGDHAAGIPWARRAIAERGSLDDPVGLAADQGALAGLLIDAGQPAEARRLLDDARGVVVAHHGEDHHEVAVIDGNLAAVALAGGDLVAAERRARAALRVKERTLGPDHPELAVTLTTLGTVRRRRGDYREAARLHRRALALLRPAVEAGHPLLATIEDNLAAAEQPRGTTVPRIPAAPSREERTLLPGPPRPRAAGSSMPAGAVPEATQEGPR
jgi:tetratricopeptide (TPR) repeat protein